MYFIIFSLQFVCLLLLFSENLQINLKDFQIFLDFSICRFQFFLFFSFFLDIMHYMHFTFANFINYIHIFLQVFIFFSLSYFVVFRQTGRAKLEHNITGKSTDYTLIHPSLLFIVILFPCSLLSVSKKKTLLSMIQRHNAINLTNISKPNNSSFPNTLIVSVLHCVIAFLYISSLSFSSSVISADCLPH